MAEIPVFYENSPINSAHGLYVFDEVCLPETEEELLRIIDALETGESKREYVRTRTTLHFGHVFNPATLKVDLNDHTVEIPPEIKSRIDLVFEEVTLEDLDQKLSDFPYDQITINRYEGGVKNGIGSHVDTHSAFTDRIISLSLGAPTVMRFELEKITDSNLHHLRNVDEIESLPQRVDIWIKPRSLIVMTGQARYLYKHKIPVRKTDPNPDGEIVRRSTRTSITIRQVRLDGICECDYPIICDYQNPSSLVLPDRVELKNDKVESDERSSVNPVLRPQIDTVLMEEPKIVTYDSFDLDRLCFDRPQTKDGTAYLNVNYTMKTGVVPDLENNGFRTVRVAAPLSISTPITIPSRTRTCQLETDKTSDRTRFKLVPDESADEFASFLTRLDNAINTHSATFLRMKAKVQYESGSDSSSDSDAV
jgi:alkylated DNA repair protein alkB homolog 8